MCGPQRPAHRYSQEDLQQQFDLLQAIRAKISEVHEAINALPPIRRQADEWEQAY